MNTTVPQFGILEPGCAYSHRPGAYGLISDAAHGIALVRTPAGLFLPGGGQDPGESLDEALIREALEETGLHILVGQPIGMADELVFCASKKERYVRKRCTFFTATLQKKERIVPIETDHETIWIPVNDALASLSHESQRWAVERLINSTFSP